MCVCMCVCVLSEKKKFPCIVNFDGPGTHGTDGRRAGKKDGRRKALAAKLFGRGGFQRQHGRRVYAHVATPIPFYIFGYSLGYRYTAFALIRL